MILQESGATSGSNHSTQMLNIQKQSSKESQGSSPKKIRQPSISSVPSIIKPSVGSVMKPPSAAHIEAKTYQIAIRNYRFEPENLNVERGSIVEWRVLTTYDLDDSNLCHMIAFEYAPLAQTKLPSLKVNESFRVRFLEPGVYNYKCQIYPRMRGTVNVFESSHHILS